jgi:hypothetical protein
MLKRSMTYADFLSARGFDALAMRQVTAGKVQGFIEGGFRFRTFVNKDDDNNWTMIADRLSDGERVAVKVIRLKAAPWIQYSIAENIDPTYIID